MMGEGEEEEGDDSMAGEEMYDVPDPEQLQLYLQMQQQQNMHIEQHDPAGVNQAHAAQLAELGYPQVPGYAVGDEDDEEGEYGDEVDDDGLAIENDYGPDDDMYDQQQQQHDSRGNANM